MNRAIASRSAAYHAFLCLLLLLGGIAAYAAEPPDIIAFEADTVPDLSAGTELTFRLEGTPRAKASVTVSGIKKPIVLKEESQGRYEGSYTISKSDRIPRNPTVRATLRQGNLATTSRLSPGLLAADTKAPAGAAAPQIQRFAMEPEAIDPGAELDFRLTGTPGGKATFAIENITQPIAMTEIRPGVYEGRYVVRRSDKFTAANVVASLDVGGRAVQSRLTSGPVQIGEVTPKDNERVANPVTITGRLDEKVDPRSVRIVFNGNDVTRDATVTPSQFTYQPRGDLTAGRYRVVVTSKDYSGNTARMAWNFEVQAHAASLPLEIVAPRDQAEVGGGPIEVRGRTAPNAMLDVQVSAITSVPGLLGFNQNVLTQTVKADERGQFVFAFEPRINMPGTRYEVTVAGRHAGQETSRKLMLVQR